MEEAKEGIKQKLTSSIFDILRKFDRGELTIDEIEQENADLVQKVKL